MDAIVVGIGTALADDPLLTARPPGPRIATRIVLDSEGRLPLTFATGENGARDADTGRDLPALGCSGGTAATRMRVLELPEQDGHVSIPSLLAELGRRRMTNLLVEGGAGVLGGFLDGPARR